ncbi:hypothetical protein [Actinomadura sp.]|jgi:hypothetical protein|uniref:hypothetical protein n=1 Tax=Actinomadura sp. TaxID=1989 RepID=UPI0037C636B4
MDELQMIREAYGEPEPPTPRQMTEARARVLAEPGLHRKRHGWRIKAGLGAVAAGAAVAVAVTVTGSGSPAPPSRVDLGRQAVLAAAEKAAAQPTGTYWFSDRIDGQSYIVRAKTGGYAIVGAHFESFRWAGAKAGTGEAFYGRDLPARPLTPRDERLWRKAGSPAKFRVWSNDHYYTYDTSRTPWRANAPDPHGGGTWLNDDRTTEDILALPADPGALAEMFFDPDESREPAKPPTNERERKLAEMRRQKREAVMGPRNKVLLVGRVLSGSPVPPDVRAAFIRALAAQPGITAIGETADPLGRKGVALASASSTTKITAEWGAPPEEQGEFGSREEIIFDRATGGVLATQRVLTAPGGPYRDREPGFVISYGIVRDTGWTDTVPEPPAKPPF